MTPRTVLVIQHAADDDVGRLGDWLVGAGLTLEIRHPYAGDALPTDLSGYDALLGLGVPQEAFDDEQGRPSAPWLPAVQTLLREAVRAAVPTLGVCLGGQLLAQACGGRVRRGEKGPEIGGRLVAKRDVAAQDPLFGALPFTPDVLQWHNDEISELPPGAVLLASSPMYPHQAFRLGERAWGLQFHVETTPEQVKRWAEERRAHMTELGLDVDAALHSAIAAHPDIEEAWKPFAQRFAALVTAG